MKIPLYFILKRVLVVLMNIESSTFDYYFFSWYEVNHHDSIKLIRIFINELHKQCFNNFCCDKKKKWNYL